MKKFSKHEKIAIIVFISILVILVVMGIIAKKMKQPDWLDYASSLDIVAVTVDGNDINLKDVAFYIAYDESVVEEQAVLYDESNTERYWNVATNNVFIRVLAKKATMDKIIHDEIFYQMAVKDNISLTDEDMETVEQKKMVFWNSIMFEDKLERLGVTEDDLNSTLEKIALAQKYQIIYAQLKSVEMEDYDIAQPFYEQLLEEHSYKVNDSVWDKVNYGEVTLKHITGIYN